MENFKNMNRYYRQTNSTYVQFRRANPHRADFIAPQGKVANFMLDDLAQQIPEYLHKLIPGGNVPFSNTMQGVGGEAQQFVRNAWDGVSGAAKGAWDNVSGAVQGAADYPMAAAQQAGQYVQGHPGQAGGAAAGVAGAGGLGAWLARLRRGQQAAAPMVEEAAQAAPGMMDRVRGAGQDAMNTISSAGQSAADRFNQLSNLQKAGLAAGGAAGLGGGAYLATRPQSEYGLRSNSANFARRRGY